MRAQEDDVAALLPMLYGLRDEVAATRFPLATPGRDEALATRERLVRQVGTYLVPRLETLDAPALVVVAGPTGGGKSTLVNSLAGRSVTTTGVLRPTTRAPVLVCHPDDADAFTGDRVLPSLRRAKAPTTDPGSLYVATSGNVPAGVALLDAPDLDSVVEENRALARELFDAADVWLLVLSAARYADAVPWEVLDAARDRGSSVTVLLDRVSQHSAGEVTADLAGMLARRGPERTPLLVVPESDGDGDGRLPDDAVSHVQGWLEYLAADWDARARLVHRTLLGTLDGLGDQTTRLAVEADRQVDGWALLRRTAEEEFARETEALLGSTGDGTALGGAVLARWRRSPLASGPTTEPETDRPRGLRGRLAAGLRPGSSVADVRAAIDDGVRLLVLAHADAVAGRTATAWRAETCGAQLLAALGTDLTRASADLDGEVARALADWHREVDALVELHGSTRRAARRYAVDRQALAVACAAAVLSGDGAADAPADEDENVGAAARTLLDTVLRPDDAAALCAEARDDLVGRLSDLLAAERSRFTRLLDPVEVDPQAGEALRAALAYVERVR